MDPEPEDLDPASIREVRMGNALGPGLLAFTGVSFFAYLLVKLGAGTIEGDLAFYGQLAVSSAMTVVGGALLARGRYHYVRVVTEDGVRWFRGLSKAEQSALAERFESRRG